jgi:hypothetical protein
MNNNLDINQTQFASQEPVLEGLANYQEPVVENQKSPKSKKKNGKLIMIGVIGFILIVVFILLLVLIKALSPSKKVVTDKNGNVVEIEAGEIDPLLDEVYILSEDLENADPSLNTIPFPPVNMELRLDSPKKN